MGGVLLHPQKYGRTNGQSIEGGTKMFCSNCGKSIENGHDMQITSCPHCGIALGDVRFPGMPYTSIQFRIVPGTPMPIDEAYS